MRGTRTRVAAGLVALGAASGCSSANWLVNLLVVARAVLARTRPKAA
jgi:hypothetical protein